MTHRFYSRLKQALSRRPPFPAIKRQEEPCKTRKTISWELLQKLVRIMEVIKNYHQSTVLKIMPQIKYTAHLSLCTPYTLRTQYVHSLHSVYCVHSVQCVLPPPPLKEQPLPSRPPAFRPPCDPPLRYHEADGSGEHYASCVVHDSFDHAHGPPDKSTRRWQPPPPPGRCRCPSFWSIFSPHFFKTL